MGLFKSKEQKLKEKEQKLKEKEEKEMARQEQAIQPLTDMGIKASKVIKFPVMLIESEYRYFVVDTENKKWGYVSNLFNKATKSYDKTLKVFNFADFINYEIIEEKENSSVLMPMLPAGYMQNSVTAYDNSTIIKYEVFITTNSKEIDDSSITLPFISHPINVNYPVYKTTKELADEVKSVLEYIKNNK